MASAIFSLALIVSPSSAAHAAHAASVSAGDASSAPQSSWLTTPPASVTESTEVTLRALVKTPQRIQTQNVMINVRNEKDEAFPTGLIRNATLTPGGRTISGTRNFSPGTYRYRAGYLHNNAWTNVGDVRTFVVTADPKPAPAKPAPWVMGYYVGYLKNSLPLESVDWSAMTHVAVGAVEPRADGTLDTTFYQDARSGPAWAKSVVDAAHKNGRKAILMIGGAESRDAFASAASDSRRAVFVDNIMATVDSLGFDGVDVDWEPMVQADGPDVLALGHELKKRRPSLQLSIPIGLVNVNLPQRTVFPFSAELAKVYDQLNIMSYGMNGGWQDWRSWHNSALYGESSSSPMSVDSSVRAFLAAGVPAKQLGVGIGFFGSCMSGVTGPRQLTSSMKVIADDNIMSYANIMTHYHRSDVARWDDAAKVPYLSSSTPLGPAGCTYVTYEDARSIAEKAKYVKSLGLGGAIVWNINEDDVTKGTLGLTTSKNSLLSALRQNFLS